MKRGHYVFVESNTTGTGRLAVERLAAGGSQVTFVTRAPEKYPFLAGLSAVRVVREETNSEARVHACLEALRSLAPVDAVLTFSTFYVPTVAAVAAKLGFRYLNPRTARLCHEKQLTREALRRHGLPSPRFWCVRSQSEAEAVAAEVRYPCVVKPPAESGSTGVQAADTPAGLLERFLALAGRAVNERGQMLGGEVLIEELLEGPEFSVETVTLGPGETRVVGVTAKHLTEPPYFVELGHDFPAPIPEQTRLELVRATLEALEAVGFDFGPAHTELRLTPGGPVVVEINPRLAGGMIPELVNEALGVDLLDVFLNQLCGEAPRLEPTRAKFASIRFIVGGGVGRLASVPDLAAAREVPLVREVAFTKGAGVTVRPPQSAADRLGYVIAAGAAQAEVMAAAALALDCVQLQLLPEDAQSALG